MLTDRMIGQQAPGTRDIRLSDGQGLALVIEPTGRRSWRLDYRFGGRQKTLRLGRYPQVTLKRARELRLEARRHLLEGRDPSVVRQQARRRLAYAVRQTFEQVAREWLERQQQALAPATYDKLSYILAKHAYPVLGPRPIGSLEPPDVLEMLLKVEQRGRRETTHRLRQMTGQIFRYAIVTGRATRDPIPDLKGALLPVRVTSHPAVTEPRAVGALLRAIDGFEGSEVVGAALQLAPLLFVRPGELRQMEWTELDADAPLWRIPERKTKMRRDHLVPLARQAQALLEPLRELTGRRSIYVFPNARSMQRPLSDMALGGALRRIGYDRGEMTPHGFRAMARTLLDERLRFPPDVIEVQLAHRVRGPLGDVYNRSQYIEERTRMMQAWADYLDELRAQT